MTTNTDAAREAAAKAIAKLFWADVDIGRHQCFYGKIIENDEPIWKFYLPQSNPAIDAFLAKALEGADEKLAEIRERNKALGGHFPRNTLSTMHLWANELYADNTALLTLVTAMSAKLAAQKAAHAKMLREEADKLHKHGRWESASHIRRLADKIAPQVKG